MRRKILFLVIAFITFLCLMTVGHFVFKPSGLDRVTVIDEGWNVRYNDTEYENIRLSDLRELLGHGTFAGDVLILSKELDNLSDYGHPTITFETRFSAYRVLVNGHLLYEEYCDPEYQNRFVGCDNEYITMPALEGTSTAVIELHVTQDGAYSYYEPVVLGDFQDVMHFMIYNNLFVFISSVFLIVFGLMFFAIALGFRSVMQDFDIQIYSSLLFITLGIWFLTQFKLLDVFIDTRGHQTEIEYMSLYLAAPLLIMSAGCVYNSLKNRVFYIFISIAVVAAVLPVFLHFTGILYINKFLPIFQAVSMVLLIYMIYLLVTGYRNKKISSSQYIQLVGQALLILSFLFNFIFYLVEKSGLSEQIMLSKKAVPFGALCMAFTTLVNYCLFISDSYAHKKEYQSLAHLAYADGLTNLPNRSRYEKYASDLSRTANDYCIISIDLNGLKGVNDNEGHLMGDKYISEFGRALDTCFEGRGFVARIGGDEFVAILQGDEMKQPQSYIDKLNAALDRLNRSDPRIKRSAAAGYAFRHEADDDNWNSVYLLADERMYRNKAEMHAAM